MSRRPDCTTSHGLVTVRLALMLGVALAVAAVLPTRADDSSKKDKAWPMIGHDVSNTRSQPKDAHINPKNASRLLVKWELTTAGDVSATPAVVRADGRADDEDDDDHDVVGLKGSEDAKDATLAKEKKHGYAVYFPDWGGKLWKLDAETGRVIWSRSISEYNNIPNSVSRTSPAYAHGMIFIGDLNGNMMAVDAASGNLVWLTRLDPNVNTIVTTSPVVYGDRLYISTSSAGGGVPRQIFRGSMIALDQHTGRILWQSFALPDNGGVPGGFSGGAFVNPPAIDVENGLVFGAAGQLYFQPASVTACLAAHGGWSEACFPPGANFNSVIAFDLRTGATRWSFRGAGPEARRLGCGPTPPPWCAPWENNFSTWDFAGSGANVFETRINKHKRDVVGIGQKSGVYWLLDAKTGQLIWSRLVGHADDPGGIQWGSAQDGERIYVAIGHNTRKVPYTLPSGETITGGSWAALDPSTGAILWQIKDPLDAPDLGALTVADGVVYGGSMAHTGDQMYALNASNGNILWRHTAGGSVVAGPAIVRGTVYWGSGYARTGGSGNNKFFAFSVDGR